MTLPAVSAYNPRCRDRIPKQTLSRDEMIAELRVRMGGCSLRKCGEEWFVDWREIHGVIKKREYPGERLLEIMGLREERDVRYVRVEKERVR